MDTSSSGRRQPAGGGEPGAGPGRRDERRAGTGRQARRDSAAAGAHHPEAAERPGAGFRSGWRDFGGSHPLSGARADGAGGPGRGCGGRVRAGAELRRRGRNRGAALHLRGPERTAHGTAVFHGGNASGPHELQRMHQLADPVPDQVRPHPQKTEKHARGPPVGRVHRPDREEVRPNPRTTQERPQNPGTKRPAARRAGGPAGGPVCAGHDRLGPPAECERDLEPDAAGGQPDDRAVRRCGAETDPRGRGPDPVPGQGGRGGLPGPDLEGRCGPHPRQPRPGPPGPAEMPRKPARPERRGGGQEFARGLQPSGPGRFRRAASPGKTGRRKTRRGHGQSGAVHIPACRAATKPEREDRRAGQAGRRRQGTGRHAVKGSPGTEGPPAGAGP